MGRYVTIRELNERIPVVLTRDEHKTATIEGVHNQYEQELIRNVRHVVSYRDKNLSANIIVCGLRGVVSLGGKWTAIIDSNEHQTVHQSPRL